LWAPRVGVRGGGGEGMLVLAFFLPQRTESDIFLFFRIKQSAST
jgi:hypothetical protein